jgi:pimeloyl-ACP methyl ester carboxylesterase
MICILILKVLALALLAVLSVSLYGAVEIIRVPFLAIPATPTDYGLDYERVEFSTVRGVELTGWWIPADKPSPITIIVQHGIGSNAGDMLPSSLCLRNDGAWNLFYYNFRGHGDSGGRHTSLGPLELQDLRHAVKFIKHTYPKATQRLGIYGHSLGAAVAIVGTAEILELEGVIAENSFSDIRQTIRRFAWVFYRVPYYPFIPIAILLASLQMRVRMGRFSPAKSIGKISPRPVLLLHGELDRRMPKSDVRALWDAAQEPKELFTIPMAGHGDAWLVGKEEYEKRMVNFFKALFGGIPA